VTCKRILGNSFLSGQVPPEFYIELILRTILVYVLVTFAMKHMGKCISAELDRTKLAAISTIAAGSFSFIEKKEAAPGLPVIPDWDVDFPAGQKPWQEWKVCSNCGNKQNEKETHCPVCGNTV